MRNDSKKAKSSKISAILAPARRLPVFSLANLGAAEKDRQYLKILLSRYVKRGDIIRLKKGWYVAREYMDELERRGGMSNYLEWLAITLHQPSYLSSEYVLYEHNALTEMPQHITAITTKKPKIFRNRLGTFIYRHVKPELFTGFVVIKKGAFYIAKATLAKALFDWLYLRQHALVNEQAIAELRLNGEAITPRDWKELRQFCFYASSKRMQKVFTLLYAYYRH